MAKTLVTFLLDRTGSMAIIKNDTIGAFNTYLETLQKDGADIAFTLLQFDSVGLDKVCVNVPVAEAPKLTDDSYQPRAWTPLIDAAYKTIRAITPKDDEKVVVCIQTDGEENASQEYTWGQLNELIREKTELGWQFNFMGASIDAYKQASKMGVPIANTMSYDSSDYAATMDSFVAQASNTAAYARGMSMSTGYTATQKKAAKDKFDPALKQADPPKTKIVKDFTL